MNQIIEQIEKIKQINSNNNLVIFVGAGFLEILEYVHGGN